MAIKLQIKTKSKTKKKNNGIIEKKKKYNIPFYICIIIFKTELLRRTPSLSEPLDSFKSCAFR